MLDRMNLLTTAVWLAGLLALAAACGDPECKFALADGTCVGLIQTSTCSESYCTAGASCARTYFVDADASTSGDGSSTAPFSAIVPAAARAVSGDCIAVAAGTHSGQVSLAGGVSLLGKGAEDVTITGPGGGTGGGLNPAVILRNRSGGLLRGFSVGGQGRGVAIVEVKGLRVEGVRIREVREVGLEAHESQGLVVARSEIVKVLPTTAGQFGVGVLLNDGSDARFDAAAVADCAAQGICANEARISVKGSLVRDNADHGVVIRCTGDARCKSTLASVMESSTLSKNRGSSVLQFGGKLTATSLDIGHAAENSSGIARGLEAQARNSETAELQVSGCRIHHSAWQGVLLQGATGKIAASTVESNGDRGIWVQKFKARPGSLVLENSRVADNELVGVGATEDNSLIIKGGQITGTRLKIYALGTGTVEAGDAVQILEGSEMAVDAVRLDKNARVAVLLDKSKARVSGTVIDGNKAAIILQNGPIDSAAYSNNKDGAGKPIDPKKPDSDAYSIDARALAKTDIGHLPIPMP
jgi:hypothetical protein